MSEHKKTITAISWCPHNPEVFASASADNLLIIWNVAEQKAITRLDNTKGTTAHTLTVLLVSLNTHQLKTHIPPDMYPSRHHSKCKFFSD